tara:strand:+ start:290 stop:457 length:168 start_codon:yes stop_codon:yes gene_type:complete
MNSMPIKEIDLWDFPQKDVETLVEIIEAKLHDLDIEISAMSFSINVEYTVHGEGD